VNVLIVLGSERLFSDMNRRFSKAATSSGEFISVIKLEKSGGCVDRDGEFLQQMHQAQIKDYFFGNTAAPLNPHTQQLDFNDVNINKVVEGEPPFSLD
jgi:polyribonucleotide 5'-hydroxyl-kinase